MAKESSLNRKGMIKEGTLKHLEGRINRVGKIWVNMTDFPFLPKLPKLWLMVEARSYNTVWYGSKCM